jgi:DNA modification methylase
MGPAMSVAATVVEAPGPAFGASAGRNERRWHSFQDSPAVGSRYAGAMHRAGRRFTDEEYLLKMRKIIHQAHRVLNEGRFFVMNIAPVLIRRASRNQASKRIPVPFDMHQVFTQEGFDFIDDIIWVKPEGAGWATGRG